MLRSGTGNVLWEPKTNRANLAQGVPLRLGCALESPGQTWKYLFLGPSPRDSDLIVLEYGSEHQQLSNFPDESSVPQSWESWLQGSVFQILEGVRIPLRAWVPRLLGLNHELQTLVAQEESQKVHFYQLPKWSQLPCPGTTLLGGQGRQGAEGIGKKECSRQNKDSETCPRANTHSRNWKVCSMVRV